MLKEITKEPNLMGWDTTQAPLSWFYNNAKADSLLTAKCNCENTSAKKTTLAKKDSTTTENTKTSSEKTDTTKAQKAKDLKAKPNTTPSVAKADAAKNKEDNCAAKAKDKELNCEELAALQNDYQYMRNQPSVANFWTYLAGLMITAVSLTFGAPFWFETLTKLVNVRQSGKPAK
jgi:hypothetical protein